MPRNFSDRYEKFLGILDRVADAAISTDIIVGFPGETEEDFQETLRVVEAARFASAFTLQYSIRPAHRLQPWPTRFRRQWSRPLRATHRLQERVLLGREVELLVANGEGRKARPTAADGARDSRISCTSKSRRVRVPRPGDIVTVTVTKAAPFHLIADSADGAPLTIRRTRAGKAWDRAEAESCAVPAHGTGAGGTRTGFRSSPAKRGTAHGLRVSARCMSDPSDGER